MRKHILSLCLLLTAAFAAAADFSQSQYTRVEPVGYRVKSSDEYGPIQHFDASAVTVSPAEISSAETNKPVKLTATRDRDYKIVCWQKFDGNTFDPTNSVPLEEFAPGADSASVAYDAKVDWVCIVVVVEYDPVRTVKTALSSFGKGTLTVTPQKSTYLKGDAVTMSVEPAKGYSFVRWSDGNSDHVRQVTLDGDLDLKAYVEPDSSRVTFSPGEDAVLDVTEKRVSFDSAYGFLPVPVRSGQAFLGWLDGEGKSVTAETRVTATGDHVLIADWEVKPATYFVVFDANGGTGLVTRLTKEFVVGASQKLPLNTFYWSEHVFVGWNQSSTAEEKQFADEQIVSDLAPEGGMATLYAVWRKEAVSYVVRFDANGGTGEMIDQEFAGGEEKSLNGCNFRREGYTFLGWSTDKDAIAPTYQDRERVQNLTSEKTLTLYAVWTANPVYYIDYKATASDEDPYRETVEQGKGYTLASNRFSRAGYAFAGWVNGSATNAAGTVLTDQQVKKLAGEKDTIVFVAAWPPISYTITLDGNGGTCTIPDNPRTAYYDKEESFTISDNTGYHVTRSGYKLVDCWSKSKDNTNEVFLTKGEGLYTYLSVSNLTTVAGTNVILYAVWKGDPQTVTINGEEQKILYGSELKQPPDPALEPGYAFGGWASNGVVVTFPIVVTGSFALEPIWTTNHYKVAFHGNGADGGTMEPQVFTYDVAQALTSNAFTRTGYAFANWTNATGTAYENGAVVKNLATNDGAVVDLYATWEDRRSYTVRFNPKDGEGTPYFQILRCGKPTALDANRFARTGYGFAGWGDGGDTVAYTNGAVVTDLAAENETNDLYAVWTPNRYWVKFDGSGADSGTMEVQAFVYDVAQDLSKNLYGRIGHAFTGWKTNATDEATAYADCATVSNLTAEADVTNVLFAAWTVNRYVLTFDSAGGSAVDPITNAYGSALSAPADPTRLGYSFVGWYEGNALFDFSSGMPPRNVTLVAKWNENGHYTAYFRGNGGRDASGRETYEQAFTNDIPQALASNAFVRAGHDFLNWTNAEGKVYADGATVTNLTKGSSCDLFANWKVHTHKLVWKDGDEEDAKADVPYGTELPPREPKPRTGYVFMGWATNETVVTLPIPMPDHDLTLETTWRPVQYEIAFDGNGASGSMDAIDAVYNQDVTLTSNKFVCAGKSFSGWAKTKDGPKKYDDGAVVRDNLTTSDGATVKLFAVWTEKAGNPLALALGLDGDFGVAASPDSAWTVVGEPSDENGLQRLDTAQGGGTLSLTIPSAGTLSYHIDLGDNTFNSFAWKFEGGILKDDAGNGSYKKANANHSLTFDRGGTLVFEGLPDEDCVWTLSNFNWTPAN